MPTFSVGCASVANDAAIGTVAAVAAFANRPSYTTGIISVTSSESGGWQEDGFRPASGSSPISRVGGVVPTRKSRGIWRGAVRRVTFAPLRHAQQVSWVCAHGRLQRVMGVRRTDACLAPAGTCHLLRRPSVEHPLGETKALGKQHTASIAEV